jgi:subtilisin family serine protease
MSRALRAARPADVAGTRLERLVENGYARAIEPVFDVAAPPDVLRRGVRYLAAAAAPRETMRHARGLVEITLDRGTDAHDLAAHLGSLSGEVEYAYVPAIRHAFGRRGGRRRPDPLASRQWGHGAVRIAYARRLPGFVDASRVTVAVADSGIDASHPDLEAAVAEYQNFVRAEDDRDYIGHGTHVAGIISAGLENGVGISGLCAARILALKVLPRDDDDWSASAYYRGLRYALGRAQVLNLSLGGPKDPGEIDVLQDLIDAGVVVLAAMGNEYGEGNPIEYPAAIPSVCAVGATDQLDRRASFSNTGRHIDLVAPGVEILSTTPTHAYEGGERNYASWDGTSMATPHVAAAAALVLAASPRLKPAQVIRRLKAKADRVPAMRGRSDSSYGSGRLNIEAALR